MTKPKKGAPKKPEKVAFHTRVTPELAKRFFAYLIDSGMSKTNATGRILTNFLDKLEEEKK